MTALNKVTLGVGALTSRAQFDIIEAAMENDMHAAENISTSAKEQLNAYECMANATHDAGQSEKEGLRSAAWGKITSSGMNLLTFIHEGYTAIKGNAAADKAAANADRAGKWADKANERLQREPEMEAGDRPAPAYDERHSESWIRSKRSMNFSKDEDAFDFGTPMERARTQDDLNITRPKEVEDFRNYAQRRQKQYDKEADNHRQSAQSFKDKVRFGLQGLGTLGEGIATQFQAQAALDKANQDALKSRAQFESSALDMMNKLFSDSWSSTEQQRQATLQAMAQIATASHA